MKILLVGGSGYVGSVLTPKLLERGYEVDVVDLLWFGNNLPKSVNVVQKDVFELTEDEVKKYEQIVFLAGLSNDPMADYSPAQNFIENASSPAYLAYIAKRAGVKRYIYGSSCSVYGYTVNELYDEQCPTISNHPYGISKLQGEFGSLQLQDETFSVICFRQGTICGYSPRMRLDLIVNTMFKTAVADCLITVDNPAIWRPILAIQDAASAYIRGIEAPEGISGVFNICSGNFTVGETADYVKDGVKEYLNIDAKIQIKHKQDFRNYKVNTEKAQNVLSFKPRFGVKDIVKELADNIENFNDFDNERYYNIRTFKKVCSGYKRKSL